MVRMPEDTRHTSGGESIDHAAQDAVRLAHRALERFPEIVQRHKFIAGGAAVSSALVVLAGVAIARRMRRGATAEQAVAAVTAAELNGQRVDLDADPALPVDGTDGTGGAGGAGGAASADSASSKPAAPEASNTDVADIADVAGGAAGALPGDAAAPPAVTGARLPARHPRAPRPAR